MTIYILKINIFLEIRGHLYYYNNKPIRAKIRYFLKSFFT